MNSKPTELRFKFYNNLKALDVSLNNIIDGGCHEGGWTERVKEIYPDANYHLIDAQDIFKDKLIKISSTSIK